MHDSILRTGLAACAAAACSLAVPAAASVSDFRLPPDPSTQAPPPDRVGPVAPDVPESRARPTPTPTPSATAAPVIVPPIASQPTPRPARSVPSPAATAVPREVPSAAPGEANPSPSASTETAAPSVDVTPPLPAPATPAPTLVETEEGGGVPGWLLILGGLLALGGLGLAAWSWWQRRQVVTPQSVPQVERPRVGPQGAPTSTSVPAAEPLQVTLEPLRLSLTLINATLSYRLEIANRGASPIEDLRIGADMISAHASMSREEQLAGPRGAPQQRIARLEPGATQVVEGEFRVPFSQIVPIRQGNAALLLPLARFRLEAAGSDALVRTFVVGQPGQGAGLQPFRLDLGPRIYPRLAQKAFA